MTDLTTGADGAALVTRVKAAGQAANLVTDWLVTSMIAGCDADGFLSAEILPADHAEAGEWMLIQRFNSSAQLAAWRATDSGRDLLQEFAGLDSGVQVAQEEHAQYGERGSVATAIVTQVKPGMETQYRDWERRIQCAQATFPGYRGSYLQPPTGSFRDWMTLLRFENPESLNNWFASARRKALIDEAESLVKSTEIRRVSSSFPGWFPVDESTGQSPARWKTFLLVLLGLYPIVSCEVKFFMPLLAHVPVAVANLLGNLISVSATTWLTMPLFIGWFKSFLFPPADATWHHNAKWLAFIGALFALEVGVLSLLLN